MLPILLELGQFTTSVLAGFAHIILHAAGSDGLSPQSPCSHSLQAPYRAVTQSAEPPQTSHSLPSPLQAIHSLSSSQKPVTVYQASSEQSWSAQPDLNKGTELYTVSNLVLVVNMKSRRGGHVGS